MADDGARTTSAKTHGHGSRTRDTNSERKGIWATARAHLTKSRASEAYTDNPGICVFRVGIDRTLAG